MLECQYVQEDCEVSKPIEDDFVSEKCSGSTYKVVPVSKVDNDPFSKNENPIIKVPEKYTVRECR